MLSEIFRNRGTAPYDFATPFVLSRRATSEKMNRGMHHEPLSTTSAASSIRVILGHQDRLNFSRNTGAIYDGGIIRSRDQSDSREPQKHLRPLPSARSLGNGL